MRIKQNTLRHFTLVMTCALSLSACQSMTPRGGPVVGDINKSLDESVQQQAVAQSNPVTPPPEVSAALIPPLNVELSGVGEKPVERRFDITVNRAPARSFFMSLAKDTPYNMIVHPAVKGKITLSLKNVTIAEVMETVRNVYGYEYLQNAGGYEVLPAKMQSRVFKLNYLNVKRSGISQVRVSSGQVSDANTGNADSSNNANNSSDTNRSTISGSQVNTQSESDFWKELTVALTAIIGHDKGRQVIINPQSGIVVVRAMPSELRAVSEYLKATQAIIERQVILEAKILEVELNDGFQSGINWSILGTDKKTGDTAVAGQFGGSTVFTTGYSNLEGKTDVLNPAFPADIRSDVASAFGGMFAMSLNFGDFTGFLEFLKTQGDVQVLSSPRVSTVNNQKAVIKVGTDEFFVTDVDSQTNTGSVASTTQSVDVELTPFFSGVALDVIPQISDDGVVTLHIHPSVSEVNEKVKQINITTTNQFTIPLAQSTIRESDSIVRARSGQVVVIGGLMQNQTKDSTASVPLLGDLPLVGSLFRHKNQVTRKSELVILLRPIVVNNDEVWSEELQKATRAMDGISKFSQMPAINIESSDQ